MAARAPPPKPRTPTWDGGERLHPPLRESGWGAPGRGGATGRGTRGAGPRGRGGHSRGGALGGGPSPGPLRAVPPPTPARRRPRYPAEKASPSAPHPSRRAQGWRSSLGLGHASWSASQGPREGPARPWNSPRTGPLSLKQFLLAMRGVFPQTPWGSQDVICLGQQALRESESEKKVGTEISPRIPVHFSSLPK